MQVLDDAAPRGKGQAQLSLPRDQEGGSVRLRRWRRLLPLFRPL